MILALDCETSGKDLYHSARPFFVTTCNESGEQAWWHWRVNPLTRDVQADEDDLRDIEQMVENATRLVGQHFKFDATALTSLIPDLRIPWNRLEDTLLASHLLASNQGHSLDELAVQYLGRDISHYENDLEEAVKKARRLCRSHLKGWAIAKEGMPGLPSVKGSGSDKEDRSWKNDGWLPRELCLWAQQQTLPKEEESRRRRKPPPLPWWYEYSRPDHPWLTVLERYANVDSAVTLAIWQEMERELHRRGLWAIYRERMRLVPIAFDMERKGVTVSRDRLEELRTEYSEDSRQCALVCVNIAKSMGHDLTLPRSGVNQSLRDFVFGVLKVPPIRGVKAKTSQPTLNAAAMETYLHTLERGSKELAFVKSLMEKRKRDTAVLYLDGYTRFWQPLKKKRLSKPSGLFRLSGCEEVEGWYVLHPSLNLTGTQTLRWSSQNPNSQNCSKREGFNLRRCFGPAPGREWWSMDFKNVELRIPAYECGEEEFIALFERPDDPPYFGSNHLLVAHLLHPREFEACKNDKREVDGRIFKKKYASTLYQWVKNGDFALQYNAVDKEDGTGTADRAFHMPGAQSKIKARFKKQEELSQHWIRFADKHGYVETLPDRTVDPKRGYPLMCQRSEWGKVKPTIPLSYHVQGSAMWLTARAMVRVCDRLEEWREEGFDAHLILQVHDELVIDTPKGANPKDDPKRSNLSRLMELKALMEMGGEDLIPRIPTPVGLEYHDTSWAEGYTIY